jgi:hypothetical protein
MITSRHPGQPMQRLRRRGSPITQNRRNQNGESVVIQWAVKGWGRGLVATSWDLLHLDCIKKPPVKFHRNFRRASLSPRTAYGRYCVGPATLRPYLVSRNLGQWLCVPPFRCGLPFSSTMVIGCSCYPYPERTIQFFKSPDFLEFESPIFQDTYRPYSRRLLKRIGKTIFLRSG